jgi:hypothetical protein
MEQPPAGIGNELAGLRWIPANEVGTSDWPLERFELWSQLALRLLRPASHEPGFPTGFRPEA